jgi:hypothetical protein
MFHRLTKERSLEIPIRPTDSGTEFTAGYEGKCGEQIEIVGQTPRTFEEPKSAGEAWFLKELREGVLRLNEQNSVSLSRQLFRQELSNSLGPLPIGNGDYDNVFVLEKGAGLLALRR